VYCAAIITLESRERDSSTKEHVETRDAKSGILAAQSGPEQGWQSPRFAIEVELEAQVESTLSVQFEFKKENEMVDVRKSLVVLALFALIAGGAFAQVQVTCTLGAANNLPIRDNGLTEVVGTVQMNCTNTTGAAVNVNFGTIMNTTVTNTITSSTTLQLSGPQITGTAPDGSAIAPVSGFLQHRPETGDVANTRNRIVFDTLSIPPTVPNGTPVSLVISGIRVVAPPASTSFTPSTVVETITTSPVGAVNIPNPQSAVVGTVTAGLVVDLTSCSGGTFSQANFAQCVSEPRTNTANWNLNIRFSEGFASAFKNSVDEGAGAATGTQLMAKFLNVPAGAQIWVTTAPVITSAGGGSVTPNASLNTGTGTGVSSSATLPSGVTPTCTIGGVSTTATWRQVTISSGTGFATWTVTAENPTNLDSMSFGVLIAFTASTGTGLPGLTTTTGPAQIQGEFGPTSTVDSAVTASTASIPRFRDVPVFTGNIFGIAPCVTNLLFPYVTTATGWDTGIALSNTSLDQVGTTSQPFATSTQTGTCTAYYFTKPGSTAPAPQTTDHALAPGEVLAFSLFAGGVPGATSTVPVGFTGYMIVRCNFQFAHGFAFISDLGSQKLSQGYLALVIPDSSPRTPTPFSSYSGFNVGEILGN
jgi:hypothetical protein